MYGKLFNRLRKGYRNISEMSCSQPVSSVGPEALKKDFSSCVNDKQQIEKSAEENGSEAISDQLVLSPRSEEKKLKNQFIVNNANHSPLASAAPLNGDWLNFIVNPQYQNWLKVNLALRLLCDYVSPIIDEVVKKMHKKLLRKHKLLTKPPSRRKYNRNESLRDQNDFTPYIEDVLKWHRQPPTIKQVYRISNVAKWPEKDGAWEVARVFMSKRDRSNDTGNTVFAFDMVYILNFLQRCRLMEEYIRNFQNVKRLFQISQQIFNNARLEIDNKTMLASFDAIFALLNDKRLFNHVEEYLEAEKLIKSVEELQFKSYGHITSAKHSLNILRDDAYNAADGKNHPAEERITMLQKALSGLLSVPFPSRPTSTNFTQEESDGPPAKVQRFASDREKNLETIAEKETKIIEQMSNFDEKASNPEKLYLPELSCQPSRRETTSRKIATSESDFTDSSRSNYRQSPA